MEYCSPEVFSGASYRGPEVDMWALGVTLYTMVYRVNPFTVEEMPETFSQLEFPDSEEDPVCDSDMRELLCGLLEPDPASRLTMGQALRSEWLRQIVNLDQYCWEDLFGEDVLQDHLMNDVSGCSGSRGDYY
ncbi:hypothetical protein EGW08_001251 [Elysia chlorotica]|uniref:Protein kinase domain-containing protein n=1 Tax=Elysia chlorotica TaxID=188477 RepID=A0A433UAU5_ELYCH|nr:hypothetical protein EGW08_001251 [Elysia chlorotica]